MFQSFFLNQRSFLILAPMSTETTIPQTTESALQTNIHEFLLRYLKKQGYKPIKEDIAAITDKKEDIIAVTKHGKKELIEVRGFSAPFVVKDVKEEHPKKVDAML